MSRSASAVRQPVPRRAAAGVLTAMVGAVLLTTACSGTVEATYRPPPPAPPPTTVPVTTVPPTPTVTPSGTASVTPSASADAIACGPDQIAVEIGDLVSADSSRAVPLVLRPRAADTTCSVSNPIGIELVDAAGNPLRSRVDEGQLTDGGTAVKAIPAGTGASVRVEWRATPTSSSVDPEVNCIAAKGLRLTLADGAPPISVRATLTACDGGTLVVSPAEAATG